MTDHEEYFERYGKDRYQVMGARVSPTEEERYQAFKARLMAEMREDWGKQFDKLDDDKFEAQGR